jgi:peptidoglycan/LPS O-acetylase OafA/YrhL
VISGFLITTLLLKERTRKGYISLKKFYIRRVLRIFPVAYLFLIVLVVLSIVFGVFIDWKALLGSFLYIRNLPFLETPEWYTGHFWSLSVEEQFYLFVPWLLRKNIKTYVVISLLLLLASPVLVYMFFHGFSDNYVVMLLNRLIVNQTPIIIGSLFAIFVYFRIIKLPSINNIAIVVMMLMSVIVMSNTISFIPSFMSPVLSSVLLSVVIVASIQQTNGWFYWAMNNAVMVKIGVLSYSIYIWQQIFTHTQPWSFLGGIYQTTIFNLIALAIVSFLSYYLYERWFLKLKHRFE